MKRIEITGPTEIHCHPHLDCPQPLSFSFWNSQDLWMVWMVSLQETVGLLLGWRWDGPDWQWVDHCHLPVDLQLCLQCQDIFLAQTRVSWQILGLSSCSEAQSSGGYDSEMKWLKSGEYNKIENIQYIPAQIKWSTCHLGRPLSQRQWQICLAEWEVAAHYPGRVSYWWLPTQEEQIHFQTAWQ